MTSFEHVLEALFADDSLIYAVLSSPRTKSSDSPHKIAIQPIMTKEGQRYQATLHRGKQVFHQNLLSGECRQWIETRLTHDFKQGLLCSLDADYHVLVNKAHKIAVLKKPPTRSSGTLSHNREKQYLLLEGTPVPFLVELGIMNRDGKVLREKYDKFRQINRFVEFINDIATHFSKGQRLNIVDFGCGKAYLTFALYHFLKIMHGYDIEIHGLDLKPDVINKCADLAKKLKYDSLHFAVGDISDYESPVKVDMMISLHACDTATDAAIAKAVQWDAEVILCVPCCQHELMAQVKCAELTPLLRHGILKERFAALATDAARAQLLDAIGYQTQVLEFIDMEHTPKNLLIRAVKRKGKKASPKALQEYFAFKNMLGVAPNLETRLKNSSFIATRS